MGIGPNPNPHAQINNLNINIKIIIYLIVNLYCLNFIYFNLFLMLNLLNLKKKIEHIPFFFGKENMNQLQHMQQY